MKITSPIERRRSGARFVRSSRIGVSTAAREEERRQEHEQDEVRLEHDLRQPRDEARARGRRARTGSGRARPAAGRARTGSRSRRGSARTAVRRSTVKVCRASRVIRAPRPPQRSPGSRRARSSPPVNGFDSKAPESLQSRLPSPLGNDGHRTGLTEALAVATFTDSERRAAVLHPSPAVDWTSSAPKTEPASTTLSSSSGILATSQPPSPRRTLKTHR